MNKNTATTFLLLLPFMFLCACGKKSNTKLREGRYSGQLYIKKSFYTDTPDNPTLKQTIDTFDMSFKLTLSTHYIYLKSSNESLLESMKFNKKDFNDGGVFIHSNFRYNVIITRDSFYYYNGVQSPVGNGYDFGTTFKGRKE